MWSLLQQKLYQTLTKDDFMFYLQTVNNDFEKYIGFSQRDI